MNSLVPASAYRERLWPAAWVFLATALVIPASLLVFLPISMLLGVICSIVLYAAIVILLILTTPTLEVTGSVIRAGRARIDSRYVSASTAFAGDEATAERGVRLDARSWLLVRGWIPDIVRIDLDDPNDPTPYWIVSSRHAAAFAAAIDGARRPA